MCSSAESATYLTIVPTAKTKHNGKASGRSFEAAELVSGRWAARRRRTARARVLQPRPERRCASIYVSMLMVGGLQYKEQFNTPFRTCVTRSRERVGLHRRGGTRVPCFGREALGPYDSIEPIAGIVRAAKVPLPAFSVFAWESTEFTRINYSAS